MPESGVQVGENQKRELYEEEMELAKVGRIQQVIPRYQVTLSLRLS